MAANMDWQGLERRSGGDRRTMLHERPEQERRVGERRRIVGGQGDGVQSEGGHADSATLRSATGSSVGANPEKDPDDWTTGDEPTPGPQRSYLHTLAREAGETVPDSLSKADASRLIDDLQARSGRGANPSDGIG